MPANVTHMLIAHKALQKLKTKFLTTNRIFKTSSDGDIVKA